MSETREQGEKHVHRWDQWVTDDLIREEKVSRSPCSRLDDVLYTAVIQLQGCKCGAQKRAVVGRERERFRGDDLNRAEGRAPLGNLPGSNG